MFAIPNSFGVPAKAQGLLTLSSKDQLSSVVKVAATQPTLILGGASNLLFTKNFEGTIILNRLTGIRTQHLSDNEVLVHCSAGEDWAKFVDVMVAAGLHGIENLSLIPGTVGASPIQNIGAYGVEMCESFSHLQAFNLQSGQTQQFDRSDCSFAYRHSAFKQASMRDWLIVEVGFILKKKAPLRLDYGDIAKLAQELSTQQQCELGVQQVALAVKQIRQSKLPDPAVLGNAGSFFKNPIVSLTEASRLKISFPTLPTYPVPEDAAFVKLSAGWLIDQAGWKGVRRGDAGVHAQHALVLVNYGQANGQQIWSLAQEIQASVLEKFSVQLSPEPVVL